MDLSLIRRRKLRRDQTDAEATLWRLLRGRSFVGFKFRRQHPVGPFIVDFFCDQQQLAIEQAYDERRTYYLNERGIRVLRFPTDLVFKERDGVLAAIALALGVEL